MRRKDKEITDRAVIEDIIRRSKTCHLGLSDNDRPYVVPVNFGYRDNAIYIHSAPEGRKIEILERNPKVCIAFDIDQEVYAKGEKACTWSTKYCSVLAFGTAEIITDDTHKRAGLDIIMRQYAEGEFEYNDKSVAECIIIRITIESMTGKSSGY